MTPAHPWTGLHILFNNTPHRIDAVDNTLLYLTGGGVLRVLPLDPAVPLPLATTTAEAPSAPPRPLAEAIHALCATATAPVTVSARDLADQLHGRPALPTEIRALLADLSRTPTVEHGPSTYLVSRVDRSNPARLTIAPHHQKK